MGSGKLYVFLKNRQRGVFLATVICCSILFFSNIAYEQIHQKSSAQRDIIRHHFAGLKARSDDIRGLILGGSNAMFGISAEQLSQKTGIEFYNLALLSEGFSPENYAGFISEAATMLDQDQIDFVIWSPIEIYYPRHPNDRLKDVTGKARLSLLPDRSLLKNIALQVMGKFHDGKDNVHKVSGTYGDFEFRDFRCPSLTVRKENSVNPAFIGSLTKIDAVIEQNFKNAKGLVVAPSILQPTVISAEGRAELANAAADLGLRFAFQSGIPSNDLICDAAHHPNDAGRRWRTNELSTIFLQIMQE